MASSGRNRFTPRFNLEYELATDEQLGQKVVLVFEQKEDMKITI